MVPPSVVRSQPSPSQSDIDRLQREIKRLKTRWNGLANRVIYIENGEGVLRRWHPTPLEELNDMDKED